MFSSTLPQEITPICLAPLPLFKKWELKSVSTDFCKIITAMNVDAEIAAYIQSMKERFPMFILTQFKVRDFANIVFKDIKTLSEVSSCAERLLAGKLGEKENYFSIAIDEYKGDELIGKCRIHFYSNTTHTPFWHYECIKSNGYSPFPLGLEHFNHSVRYEKYETMLIALFQKATWPEYENITGKSSQYNYLKLPIKIEYEDTEAFRDLVILRVSL